MGGGPGQGGSCEGRWAGMASKLVLLAIVRAVVFFILIPLRREAVELALCRLGSSRCKPGCRWQRVGWFWFVVVFGCVGGLLMCKRGSDREECSKYDSMVSGDG